ncbi:MAG: amidohydrolase family protein [Acidimicrobiales bacterium]|nr:amidohydrolase family protein [Acidimicrobiales bacterium]
MVNAEDLIMVSVDDHLVEPPTMFDNHLPAKYKDQGAGIVRKDDGSDVWTFNGAEIPNIGLNAVAGRPRRSTASSRPPSRRCARAAGTSTTRVKDMDAGGILGSMCFPSFPASPPGCSPPPRTRTPRARDPASLSDWHVDEWCGFAPGRFIPMGIPVIWDAELAAEEVRRLADEGVHSLTFTENPYTLGFPSFHSDHWDPLWKALVDTDTVMSIHLGSSGELVMTAPDAPMDVLITLQPMNICQAAADLLWSRIPKEYPSIKIALSEAAPHGSPTSSTGSTGPTTCTTCGPARTSATCRPWDVFRRHFLTCFITDPVGVKLSPRHRHGQHRLGARLPALRLVVARRRGAGRARRDVPERTSLDEITYRDRDALVLPTSPFLAPASPRARATVGALRRRAGDHDVSIRSLDRGRVEEAGRRRTSVR